jgi:hypothetical protein
MRPIDTEIRESTSLKLKPSVWRKAKIEAVSNDIQLSDLVEEAIEELLRDQSKIDKIVKKYHSDKK